MDPITLGLIGLAGVALFSAKKDENVTREQIEKNVLNAIKDATLITVPPFEQWVEVEHKGEKWSVAPRYIAPVGIGEGLKLSKMHGLTLPTPAMVDDIWKAADLKLEPMPRGARSKPPSDFTAKTMNSPEANIDQLAIIQNQIGDREFKLLAGTHKDIVMGKVKNSKTGVLEDKLGIYGWHRLNGKPIQDFFTGHAHSETGEDWKDYSQGLRLVKKL